MAMKPEDLTGQKFGKLTVIGFHHKKEILRKFKGDEKGCKKAKNVEKSNKKCNFLHFFCRLPTVIMLK